MRSALASWAASPNQEPWAAVLGCADGRVPPTLLFGGLNLGEIIEGPEWAVERRWQVVRETDEFRQLRIIGKKPIFNRNYIDWSMHAKDGVVIGMLYPELIKIVEEFNPSKSIFEKVSLACKTGTFAKAYQPSVFSSKLTFH